MIICNLSGGFGNHLLCVALAIIISDKYNIKIKIIGNGNGLNDFSKDTRNTIFKIINKNIVANENHNHKNIIINNKTEYYEALNNYNYNFNYIINCIHINELNIYKDNIDIINNNILINKTFDYDYENTITISLRLGCKGEVVYPSPFSDEEAVRLPFNYFSQGINTIKKNNPNINTILICCDNFEDEFIKQFEIYKKSGFNIIFNRKDTYNQFCDIINSKYFITSLSTFSLWGVLLNNNNCYVPCFNHNLSIKKNIGTEPFYINASNTLYNMKNVTRIYI